MLDSTKTRLRAFAGRHLCGPSQPLWFDQSMFGYLSHRGLTLNVGSGEMARQADAVNLDIKPHPNVDVVADAHQLPFPSGSFDAVLCQAMLEHTQRPWVVAAEIERALKPGGMACIEAPFLEGVHDEHDYFRFTLKGLRSLFPSLEEIASGVSASSNQILADLIRVFPVLVLERTLLCSPAKLIMSWLASPVRHLDFAVQYSPSMARYARAYYFVGVKR